MKENFVEIRTALIHLAEDEDQTTTTRSEPSSLDCLVSKMELIETAFLCVLCEYILERFNVTSKNLQKIEKEIVTCVSLYKSLLEFVSFVCSNQDFDNFEENAKLLVESYSYRVEYQLSRKSKVF